MSPEQCRGAASTTRADVYALGVILYEMFTGRTPFVGSFVELITQHLSDVPAPPSRHAPIAPALERLILACMEKDPAKRPASPAALRQQLEAALAEAPPAAAGHVPSAAEAPRSPVGPIAVVASGGDTLAPPPEKTWPGVTLMPARARLPWGSIGGGAATLVALVLISAYAREHGRSDRKPSQPAAVTEGLGDSAGAAAAPGGPPGHVRVLAQNASSARFYIDDRLVASGAREADLPSVAPITPTCCASRPTACSPPSGGSRSPPAASSRSSWR